MERVKRLIKMFNLVRAGAYIILTCNVVISYYHCLQLFQAVSHAPVTWLTHVGVVSLDAVFILSVVVLTESRGRGIPPWLCFLFGLSFTTWSNIRNALIENNWEGVAVGASTVCALLLIKIMLTWMEGNRRLFEHTEKEAHNAQDTHTEEPSKRALQVEIITQEEPHIPEYTRFAQEETHTQEHTNAQADTILQDLHTQTSQEDSHATQLKDAHTHNTAHAKQLEPHTQIEEVVAQQKPAPAHAKKSAHSEEETSHSKKAKSTRTEKGSHSTQEKPHTTLRDDEEEIRTVAETIRTQLGEFPSIRTLAKEAQCSEWKARNVLSALKKQAS